MNNQWFLKKSITISDQWKKNHTIISHLEVRSTHCLILHNLHTNIDFAPCNGNILYHKFNNTRPDTGDLTNYVVWLKVIVNRWLTTGQIGQVLEQAGQVQHGLILKTGRETSSIKQTGSNVWGHKISLSPWVCEPTASTSDDKPYGCLPTVQNTLNLTQYHIHQDT